MRLFCVVPVVLFFNWVASLGPVCASEWNVPAPSRQAPTVKPPIALLWWLRRHPQPGLDGVDVEGVDGAGRERS